MNQNTDTAVVLTTPGTTTACIHPLSDTRCTMSIDSMPIIPQPCTLKPLPEHTSATYMYYKQVCMRLLIFHVHPHTIQSLGENKKPRPPPCHVIGMPSTAPLRLAPPQTCFFANTTKYYCTYCYYWTQPQPFFFVWPRACHFRDTETRENKRRHDWNPALIPSRLGAADF